MIQFENAVKKYREIILDELKSMDIICWIAGGSLRDYFMGIRIQADYDIFFPNIEEYQKTHTYFLNKILSHPDDNKIIWQSENGIKIRYNGRIYDLIKKRFFNSPQETIQEFDFTVSMLAIDTEKVYFGETTFIDLAKRQLMINKITYPVSTFSRAFRYYKKGFTMCAEEMMKLVESIQDSPKADTPLPEQTNAVSLNIFRGLD